MSIGPNTENSSKCPDPIQLKQELENIENYNPSSPKVHFLSYLNNLRCGEFQMALDSLRKYSDYSAAGCDNENHFQNATLALASFYANLFYKDEALMVLLR